MQMIRVSCPACRCVSLTPLERCRAVQNLVRPDEVAHLVNVVPRRWPPSNHSLPRSVALWLQFKRLTGEVAYMPDPEWCDRWCSPAETLDRRGGDCDDLAILATSLLWAGGVAAGVVVGHHCNDFVCDGHAWVEGHDERGWFLLEATTGTLVRKARPTAYTPHLWLQPGRCCMAA